MRATRAKSRAAITPPAAARRLVPPYPLKISARTDAADDQMQVDAVDERMPMLRFW